MSTHLQSDCAPGVLPTPLPHWIRWLLRSFPGRFKGGDIKSLMDKSPWLKQQPPKRKKICDKQDLHVFRLCVKYLQTFLENMMPKNKHITTQHDAQELACNGLSSYQSTFFPILSTEPSRQQFSILYLYFTCVLNICPYYPVVRALSIVLSCCPLALSILFILFILSFPSILILSIRSVLYWKGYL